MKDLERLLYEAVAEEIGLVVRTNDTNLLRQKLYKIMRESPDAPQLALTLSRTNPDEELLIVKKEPPSDAP